MSQNPKVILSIALALGLAACSKSSQNSEAAPSADHGQSIVGGQNVGENDIVASSTVGLVFTLKSVAGEGQAICTGTLVAQNVILTAAHCVKGAVEGLAVFAPDITQASQDQIRVITIANVHPSFRPNANKNRSDVALVKFHGDLPTGYKVAELGSADLLKDGSKVILAGYGASSMLDKENDGSAILRKATVVLSKADYSDAEMLFEQYHGAGACHGDSGGPAYVKQGKKLYLIGITSMSATPEGGGTCLEGSLYEKVATFADYIQTTAQNLQNAADDRQATN